MLIVLKPLIQYQTPTAILSVQSVRSAVPLISIHSEGLTPFEGLLPSRILRIPVEHQTVFLNFSDRVCYINWIYAHITKEQYLYYHLLVYGDIYVTGMHCYMNLLLVKINHIISQIKRLLHTPPHPHGEKRNH